MKHNNQDRSGRALREILFGVLIITIRYIWCGMTMRVENLNIP